MYSNDAKTSSRWHLGSSCRASVSKYSRNILQLLYPMCCPRHCTAFADDANITNSAATAPYLLNCATVTLITLLYARVLLAAYIIAVVSR